MAKKLTKPLTAFVALYRGINVGGNNPVKMDSLRSLHEALGHQRVRSYIQSGNIVFMSSDGGDDLASRIIAKFTEQFGFAVKVLVVSAARWQEIVADNPYVAEAAERPQSVHAGICEAQPDAEGLQRLLTKTGGSETFVIKQRTVYLHAPQGIGTSKFAAGMERASGVPMTARNWKTIEMLSKMLNED